MPESLLPLFGIPGHSDIRGNARADKAAKAALSSTVSTMKCPASDLNQSTIVKFGRPDGMYALLINYILSNLTLVTAASHISVVVML